MNSATTDAIGRNAGQPRRKLNPVRTNPPGLLLFGVGLGHAADGKLSAAELIAMARVARGATEN
ncbi:hypothetical protein FV242_28025 [Methylobacterium sp. WL64]|nr:hypothetical protein FV242_28025 [Methylobacterium sp. WL64]